MKRYFSLIELLVVVAIISILAAILLPVLSSARHRVSLALCGTNVRQTVQGASLYATDNTDALPPSIAWRGTWSWPAVLNYQPTAANTDRGGRRLYTFLGDYLPVVDTYMCPLSAPPPPNMQANYVSMPNSNTAWMWQSYAIWWNYDGLATSFKGPSLLGNDERAGLMMMDLLAYRQGLWWSSHGQQGLTWKVSDSVSANTHVWTYPFTGKPNNLQVNAGYVDGHVDLVPATDTGKNSLNSIADFYLPNQWD